jgi:hypothetical protein
MGTTVLTLYIMTGKIVSQQNRDRHQISMTEKIVSQHNHDRHQISMTGKIVRLIFDVYHDCAC